MNEPRPVLPSGQGQGLGQQGGHAPASARPAGAPSSGVAPRAPGIAPPPAQRLPGQPQHAGPSLVQGARPMAPAPAKTSLPLEGDDELIDLDDDDAPSSGGATGAANVPIGQIAPGSKIKFAVGGDKHTYTRFKRPTHVTGTGACRIRSFHGRLSDDGLAFMDDKINEWLDNHPEFEVKFVNCIVGPLEGKVTGEQGLIVTIWY
jgi:hypothetical protein